MRNMVIALGGLPFAGKTTLGKLISVKTGIHYIDIDDGPARCAMPMLADPYSTPEKTRIENGRMDVLYAVLHAAVSGHVRAQRPIIISATYRTPDRRRQLLDAVGEGNLRFLLCRVDNPHEEIPHRITMRQHTGAVGGCRSIEQYNMLLPLWSDPDFPHDVIQTTNGPDDALAQAMKCLRWT